MNMHKSIYVGIRRRNLLNRKKTVTRYRTFDSVDFVLEERQLLATFIYASGLLTVHTDSPNEQISILSTSESGNYTISTTASWRSPSISGLTVSDSNLYVNQPSGLSSLLIDDNLGSVSNSSLIFGNSSANFGNNLTVNFTNPTSGKISVRQAASFSKGRNLSLTSTLIELSQNITTSGEQRYTGNLAINGNVTLDSGGSSITINGKIDKLYGGANLTSFASNGTWIVPAGVTQADILVVGGGGGGGSSDGASGGGGGGQVISQQNLDVTGTINIIVGAGGAGGTEFASGKTGESSSFGSIKAIGGGGGAGAFDVTTPGWTGGGGSWSLLTGMTGLGGDNYKGGKGFHSTSNGASVSAGGGGGSAGGTGNGGGLYQGGSGGMGVISNITGIPTFYGGGGGGGGSSPSFKIKGGSGGQGGGGAGGTNSPGLPGTSQTGGGGGGTGTYFIVGSGGNGGSGIVIVKHIIPTTGSIIINAGSGQVILNDSIGSTTPLDSLEIKSSSLTLPAVTASSLLLNSTGTITQNGPLIVSGTASLTANGDISLDSKSNQLGKVNAIGNIITIVTGGSITLGTVSTSCGLTVNAPGETGQIRVTGPIAAIGTAIVSMTGRNIAVTGNITTAAGDIVLRGNNGSYQAGVFDGVCISGSNVYVSTMGGDIVIDGRGASSSGSYGRGKSAISHGVNLTSSIISAGGNGSVTIRAVSGNGSTNNTYGVYINGACVTTNSGRISITGQSCATGSSSAGVLLSSNANISANDGGDVVIKGCTPGNITTGTGIWFNNLMTSNAFSNGGNITLSADNMNLTGRVNATLAGNVSVETFEAGVDLGSELETNVRLGLSQSEMNQITAGMLTIGSRTTGNIVLSSNIVWPSKLTLISGSLISGVQNGNTLTQGDMSLTSEGLLNVVPLNYDIVLSSDSPVIYGNIVVLRAVLTHSGSVFNTGTITFYNNGRVLGTSNIANDVATYNWEGIGAGVYQNITATGNVAFTHSSISNTETATVNPYELTVKAIAKTKVYGDTLPSLTFSNDTLVHGDDASVFTGNLATVATSSSGVGNYSITQGSLSAGSNYKITYIAAQVSVTPFNISVIANNQTKAYGTEIPFLSYTNSSLVNGDSSNVFTGTLFTNATDHSPGGFYKITTGTLSASPNYTISTFSNGTLSVSEKLSTIVTTTSDSTNQYDNLVSLREAIQYGSTLPGNKSITFSEDIYNSDIAVITLTQGVLNINDNTGEIVVQGPLIESGKTLSISGNNTFGIFKVLSPASINNLALYDATGSYGRKPATKGGAVYSSSTLVLNNMTISNSTANLGDAIYQDGGSLTLNSSNISNSIYVANHGNFVITGNRSIILPQINASSISVNVVNGGVLQFDGTSIQLSDSANIYSTGNIVLENISNDFNLVMACGTNISISDRNNISLGRIYGNGTLKIASQNLSITDIIDSTITGNVILIPETSRDINLGNKSDNTFGLTQTEISRINTGLLTIGNSYSGNITISSFLTRHGNLSLVTPGCISILAPITANSGNDTIELTANSIAFLSNINATPTGSIAIKTMGLGINLGNGIDTAYELGLSQAELNNATAGCLTIGSLLTGCIVNSSLIERNGSMTLASSNSITQSGGSLTISGKAVFMSNDNSIVLNNVLNDFSSTGSISISGSEVFLINSNETVLGQIRATAFTVNSTGGNISQTPESNIVVSGSGSFISSNAIIFSNLTNSIGNMSMISASAKIDISGVQNIGSMNVNEISFSGTGSIVQGPGSCLVVSGLANFSVSGNLILDNPNNNLSGPIIVSGNNVVIYNIGVSNLTTVDVEEITLIGKGDITQSGRIQVRSLHTAYLTSTNGNIIMNDTTNDFVGGIYANAPNIVELYNSNATVLGNISATSFMIVSAGGSITQVPGTSILVSDISRLVTNGNAITLSEPTNDFYAILADGTDIDITDKNSVILGLINAANLNVMSSGSINQATGSNISANDVRFVATGNVSLTDPTNNFRAISGTGADISINDADNVYISDIQSSGRFELTTAGTTLLRGNITTANDIIFNSPVNLTSHVYLNTSSNGNAIFNSTLNGPYTVSVNLGLGAFVNIGNLGANTTINLIKASSVTGSDLKLVIATGATVGSITASGINNTISVNSLADEKVNVVVSGADTGYISSSSGTSVGSYSGISKIYGGIGRDNFKFINNSSMISGSIDGGLGINSLDYSGTSKPLYINLSTGTATGVSSNTANGVATNIQDVFGGSGNDYLTGSSSFNILVGGFGEDTIIGLAGNDIMVGSHGSDSINGGSGSDILIGGHVEFVFGTLLDGLQSIMDTWRFTTDSTFTASWNLLSSPSSTHYRLVGDTNLANTYLLQTVFNDQAVDRIIDIVSSTTPNWYFIAERLTLGNDIIFAGTTFTVSKKTVTQKIDRTLR